jgi:hypothetical protein
MGDIIMFIEIDENGNCTGAWSEIQQDWATFEIDELPEEDLSFYVVKNGKLHYQKEKKEKLKKVDDDEKIKQNLIQYLKDTDWYAIRYIETAKAIPEDIAQERQKARDKLSALE